MILRCAVYFMICCFYSDVCVYLSHHIYPSFCVPKLLSILISSDHDITKQQQQQQKVSSPSLSQYFNKDKKQQGSSNSDAVLGKENTSADLKALLPKQKMKFMKLDVSIVVVCSVELCFVLGCVSV